MSVWDRFYAIITIHWWLPLVLAGVWVYAIFFNRSGKDAWKFRLHAFNAAIVLTIFLVALVTGEAWMLNVAVGATVVGLVVLFAIGPHSAKG